MRDAERHRKDMPAGGEAIKMGPSDLAAFGYDVDLKPLPPRPAELRPLKDGKPKVTLDDNGWHPFATELYNRLLTDPSRKWTGGAMLAMNLVMCQNLSDWLMPRVVGWEDYTDDDGERQKHPVFETGMRAGEMGQLLAWLKIVGLDEASRLRLRREITFYDPDEAPSPEESAARGGPGVVAITRAQALAGGQA